MYLFNNGTDAFNKGVILPMLIAQIDALFECGQRAVDLRVVKCKHRRDEFKYGRTQAVVQRCTAPVRYKHDQLVIKNMNRG